MACNSCTKQFSLLRKEKGCPSCGFSFCSNCLDNKTFLPKLNSEAKVCAKCKNNLSKPNEPQVFAAPDAYYRRIGATDVALPGKLNLHSDSNIDLVDKQILGRLEKLKEGRNATPASSTTEDNIKKRLRDIKGETSSSEAELYSRLAKLKGVPIEVVNAKPVLPPPDNRTEQEQANDLIKQYMEQATIDTKYKDDFNGVISDIEARMQKLKGINPTADNSKQAIPINDDSDDEETVKNIVEKIKAEADSIEDEIPPCDELPFCEICNEDAHMRCLGCRYLFCKRCYLEHKDDDDGCNRYELYKPPNIQ